MPNYLQPAAKRWDPTNWRRESTEVFTTPEIGGTDVQPRNSLNICNISIFFLQACSDCFLFLFFT